MAEAARHMDVTASAVSQRLRQFATRLGLQLIHRITRRFSLTDEGDLFYAGAVGLLADLDELTDTLRARLADVAGTPHVCGPLGSGRHHLAAAIADFHTRPAPHKPQELATHDCIVLRENQQDVTLWRFRKNRNEFSVRVTAIMSSNDGDVVRQWALMGKGLIMRSEWDVAESLAAGRPVRVLDDWRLPDAGIVALVDRRQGMSARLKLFLAFLRARFKPCRRGGSHPPDWFLDPIRAGARRWHGSPLPAEFSAQHS